MPEEYVEISYEDGEMSGSGNSRFTSRDALIIAEWFGCAVMGIAAIGGIFVGAHRVCTGHWICQGDDDDIGEDPQKHPFYTGEPVLSNNYYGHYYLGINETIEGPGTGPPSWDKRRS